MILGGNDDLSEGESRYDSHIFTCFSEIQVADGLSNLVHAMTIVVFLFCPDKVVLT